jgi:hypothetical protein
VEGHRYADDESTWYSGNQYARAAEPDVTGSPPLGNAYDTGSHERPSGAFRLPEQRPAASPYAFTDPLNTSGALPPQPDMYESRAVRGTEYPTVPPPAPALPPPPDERPSDKVYQSRRPVTALLVAVVMVVLLIPVVRLLVSQTFAGTATARGIVPAVLLTLGFALTGIGLFAMTRGGPIGRDSWLRPPVAYLPMGLILLLAAGIAVA